MNTRTKRGGWLGLAVLLAAGMFATRAEADTLQWTGATDTDWATVGNWTNVTTGATDGTPLSTDDVVIDGTPNGRHPTLNLSGGAVTIASLSLGSTAVSTQTVANGDVDTKRLIVTGNVTIGAYGTLMHAANTTAEANRLRLDVGDSMTIANGGKIDVTGKGYNSYSAGGPGVGVTRGGGAHGGEGGGYVGTTYGSVVSPTNLGSTGVNIQNFNEIRAGGGAVVLNVTNTLTCAGGINIVADGQVAGGTVTSGGAGGSVWITANALSGAGIVSANGGPGLSYTVNHECNGGGGGRIAVVLGSDNFGSVTFRAGGGQLFGKGVNGAAGTVYRKGLSDTYGTLVVDQAVGGTSAMTALRTGTYRFDSITMTNYATLAIASSAVLDLSNNPLIRGEGGMQNIRSRLVIGRDTSSVIWPTSPIIGYTISQYGTNRWTIPSDVTLTNNGVLTHEANTTARSHVLNLAVAGNLTFQSGGGIDLIGRGYNSSTAGGPGMGAGGAYGGEGGNNFGKTYGSIVAPTDLGSAGVSAEYGTVTPGGGAVVLTVSNTLTCAGGTSIVADANPPGGLNFGAAGGSVWITANALSGAGSVSAAGSAGLSYTTAHYMHGGGGGRIAVVLGSDDFGGVTFSAAGGALFGKGANGAAGTVYRKGASQSYGTLTVENDKTATARTLIRSAVSGKTVGDVVLKNLGYMSVASGETLTVYGNWSNGVATAALSGGGTVTFAGATSNTVHGDTTFENLVCQTPGKTLRFEAGKTQTVTAGLTLTGAAGNLLVLESTNPAQQWNIRVPSLATQYDVSFLSVSNSHAGTPPTDSTITATDSQDKGGNVNWVFSGGAAPIVWDGSASTDWNTAENWDLGRVPLQDDPSITIPTPVGGSPSNWPVLDKSYVSPGFDGNLVIQSGASLTLNGHSLRIGGAVTNAGTLTATGSETLSVEGEADFTGGVFNYAQSTLRLSGSAAQSFTPDNCTFYTLNIDNTNAVTVTDGFSVRDLTFPATSADVSFGGGFTATNLTLQVSNGASLTFTAGETYNVLNALVLNGAGGSPIVMNDATGSWALNVGAYASVRYVNVKYSNADGGRTIYAFNSINGGNNPNWDFGTSGKLWVGTDSSWGTDGNWEPSGVPGSGSHVLIDGGGSAAPQLTAATTIAGLTVAGIAAPATLNVDMPYAGGALTVSGNVDIWNNGTLTHTGNGTTEAYRLVLNVGSNLYIANGGRIDVTGKGYNSASAGGPGMGVTKGGGAHGGEGGDNFGKTYGSVVAPTNLGSTGVNNQENVQLRAGGGAVVLNVTNTLTCAGGTNIVADGQGPGGITSGGAGGSVWITANELSGAGVVRAAGGPGYSYTTAHVCNGGGGGRIAVVLGTDDFGGVTFNAAGGPKYGAGVNGAAGTVYRKGVGQGTVTINNNALTTTARTQIPPATNAVLDELRYASVIVTNRGALAVTVSDRIQSLTVAGTTEPLNLGTNGTVLTVESLTINGTTYTKGGLYTTNDWNGFAPAPANVTGAGEIFISASGTMFLIR